MLHPLPPGWAFHVSCWDSAQEFVSPPPSVYSVSPSLTSRGPTAQTTQLLPHVDLSVVLTCVSDCEFFPWSWSLPQTPSQRHHGRGSALIPGSRPGATGLSRLMSLAVALEPAPHSPPFLGRERYQRPRPGHQARSLQLKLVGAFNNLPAEVATMASYQNLLRQELGSGVRTSGSLPAPPSPQPVSASQLPRTKTGLGQIDLVQPKPAPARTESLLKNALLCSW